MPLVARSYYTLKLSAPIHNNSKHLVHTMYPELFCVLYLHRLVNTASREVELFPHFTDDEIERQNH